MIYKDLTGGEEKIMLVLWMCRKAFVKEIIEKIEGTKPAYNTVSTIIRILEVKGFVGHESFGKSHRYFPKISKTDYKKYITSRLLANYFNNSREEMIHFILDES
jgi:BlaI family penicillinase repressor